MSRFDEPGWQCMTGHLLRRNNLNAANATMAKSAFTLAKGKTGDEAGDAGHTYDVCTPSSSVMYGVHVHMQAYRYPYFRTCLRQPISKISRCNYARAYLYVLQCSYTCILCSP